MSYPKRVMAYFSILISAVGGICLYLYFSVIQAIEPLWARGSILVIMFALLGALLWMPLSYWRVEKPRNPKVELLLIYSAYTAMALISFSLALAVAKDLVLLAFQRAPWHSSQASWGVLAGTLVCCLVGFWSATQNLKIKNVKVPIKDLPKEFEGFKIVQISDLHVGPTIKKSYVERVVKLANEADADIVCLTGDMIDGEVAGLHAEIAPIQQIQARHGKFYVLGNHEYYWDAMGWKTSIENLGFQPLLNANANVAVNGRSMKIVGLTDPAAGQFKLEKPNFERALGGVLKEDFKILLVHQPQYAKEAETWNFQLQLSGHTHGGQFFPWTLIAKGVHKYNSGLEKLKELSIYVSVGTGYWGPPIRLGAPSEVTLLTLTNA
jgi:predicted MPP superfamily phosphohydrolase